MNFARLRFLSLSKRAQSHTRSFPADDGIHFSARDSYGIVKDIVALRNLFLKSAIVPVRLEMLANNFQNIFIIFS